MKWLIASDIHGSAHWCSMLMEAFSRERAQRLILLGDILYHGPRNPLPEGYDPAEVARMLNAAADRIFCVQGNCDSQVDQMVLDFPIMAEYAVLACAERLIYLTHGHIHSFEKPPKFCRSDVLVHGHTHVPICREMEGFTYINPGSVSLPKEDSPRGYVIFEDGRFTWKDMEGKSYMSYKL